MKWQTRKSQERSLGSDTSKTLLSFCSLRAAPAAVRFVEGAMHGFLLLRSSMATPWGMVSSCRYSVTAVSRAASSFVSKTVRFTTRGYSSRIGKVFTLQNYRPGVKILAPFPVSLHGALQHPPPPCAAPISNETVFTTAFSTGSLAALRKRRGRQTDPFFNRSSFRPRCATSRSRPSHQSRPASQPVPTCRSDRSAAGAASGPCCHSSRSSPAGRPRITGYACRRPHRS